MRDSSRQRLGKLGEDIAARYLQKHGYTIIERNFKKRYGELDIIATFQGILVFVEVKARSGKKFGYPEESVTSRKLAEVKQTSEYYAMIHPEFPKRLRIDVIGIELDEVDAIVYFKHIQNVTQ